MTEDWYVAFAATLAVEVPLWTAAGWWTGATARRALATGLAVNAVSHPLLWFVLAPALTARTSSTLVATLLAEGAVVVLEAAMARRLLPTDLPTAACIAVATNSLSLALGLLWWR